MKIDEIDVKILRELFKEKFTSTTSMAKKIYPDETNNNYELKKKDVLMRSRLEKLNGLGLVEVDKNNGSCLYFINKTKCNLLHGKLIVVNKKEDFLVDSGNFLVYKINNKACCVRY